MRILTIGLCLLAACEHSRPYDVAAPDPLGPKDDQLPRRISFSTGDDRHPAVSGDVVVYSRLDPGERGRERCLAFLPAGGGTIRRESCPPPQQTPADTFVDTWIEPAVSPDGRHVAYMWQQGSLISVLGFAWSSVVVARTDGLGETTELVWPIFYVLPNGRISDAVSTLSWADAHTLRFLIGYEFIFKVKGGGLERYTDTTFESFGLAELDVTTGAFHALPAGAGVFAYAPAPDGGLWVARGDAPQRLLHLASGADSATAVGDYSGPIGGLANVAGLPVAIVADTTVEWLLAGDSVPRRLTVGAGTGPLRRIAAEPGSRRFVAEIERGWDLFGDPANLWLYELP